MTLYPTYIDGLDDHLGGGIPRGHVVLIQGPSGAMKSTVAYSILHHNVRAGNARGLYVSFEQARPSILYQMKGCGFKTEEVGESLAVLDLALIRKSIGEITGSSWLEVFKMYVKSLREQIGYDFMVLDSLTALAVVSRPKEPRVELFRLFEWLKEHGFTVLTVAEDIPASVEGTTGAEEVILADGVIRLEMVPINVVDVKRRLRVPKMRGVHHPLGYFDFEVKAGRVSATKAVVD
ncbi:MAG TPA: RAD55 family ATPase [Candidatus Thermoplasmatota archaeon]